MDEEHQDSYDEPDDESERDYEQYLKERDELLKRELSNSQLFDKAILALSSAGLGFSLAFIRKGFSLVEAIQVYLLYSSWILFAVAIASTLISFFTGQCAIKKQLKLNESHYLENKEKPSNSENKPDNSKNRWNQITKALSCVSLIFYILAIFLTTIFAILNPNTNHILNEVSL